MENDLIRRSDALAALRSGQICGDYCKRDIYTIPAVDAVDRSVYEQVAWERDMAIAQLKDIGKGLGEKMDDVAKVVRCRECYWYSPGVNDAEAWQWCVLRKCDTDPHGYCHLGDRREDGDGDG